MSDGSGSECFYEDEHGKKQDASIHDEILAEGEDDMDAFDALIDELGLTDAFAAALESEDDEES